MGHDHDNDDDHHIFGAVFPRALYGRPTVKTPLLTMSKFALLLPLYIGAPSWWGGSSSIIKSLMIMSWVVINTHYNWFIWCKLTFGLKFFVRSNRIWNSAILYWEGLKNVFKFLFFFTWIWFFAWIWLNGVVWKWVLWQLCESCLRKGDQRVLGQTFRNILVLNIFALDNHDDIDRDDTNCRFSFSDTPTWLQIAKIG